MALIGPWRTLRGVLAAVLVLVFAAAPSLDPLICADDALVAAEAAAGHAAAAPDPCPELADHDRQGGCHHGHCHHGGGFVAPAIASASAPLAWTRGHRLVLVVGGPADMQFGVRRPPRA